MTHTCSAFTTVTTIHATSIVRVPSTTTLIEVAETLANKAIMPADLVDEPDSQ